MDILTHIDPFLWQLVILPTLVIGIGVYIAVKAKRAWIAPIITLLLNLGYELWYFEHFYPDSDLYLSSWNFIFPSIALAVAGIVRLIKRREEKNEKTS